MVERQPSKLTVPSGKPTTTGVSAGSPITPTTYATTSMQDTDLQVVVDRWAALPDAVKAGIMAMVEAVAGR